MKDNTVDILCQLEERAVKDIKKLLMKDDITPAEWDTAGKAVDIIKDVTTTKAMKEEYPEEEEGYSEKMYRRMYPDYDGYSRRYMNGGNRMYMNDGMNRGSRTNSSYAAEMNNAAINLRNLMNQATNETERSMYARWLDEAERTGR